MMPENIDTFRGRSVFCDGEYSMMLIHADEDCRLKECCADINGAADTPRTPGYNGGFDSG
jgi:hypothetical protein